MKRKVGIGLLILAAATMMIFGALAADVFQFASRSIDLFEGETGAVALIREGNPAGDGTITYTTTTPKTVSVDPDGTIHALNKGTGNVKVTIQTAKRSWTASMTVNVIRRVTNVTLNTTKLKVYHPEDATLRGLLREETDHDVILVSAGKSIDLKASITPNDANNRKVLFSSSDEGILKAGSASARAIQAGECELTISSVQNPEIREVYHVLVIQPVTKVSIASTTKTIFAGEMLQLQPVIEPVNASIQAVEWKSRNEKIATVNADGVVTGLRKGNVTIEAKAADGSGKVGTYALTVGQRVTAVTIKETGLNLAAGQTGYLHATASPAEANDKGITWSSSDPTIATVTSGGQVKALRRGECDIIAASKSNPEVSSSVKVQVVQRVTGINFTGSGVSLPIRTTAQLTWEVQPADATIKDVTFSSSNKKVATVDANGVVTGLTRGTTTITATATDGSKKKGSVKVTVTQPVEGMAIQYGVYHVQLERSLNIKAIVSPSNANNQNVHFTIGDEYIATVTDNKNIGRVKGWHAGSTTITGVTEDGGYTATAEIRVADFNRAIVVDDLYLEGENIRIVLRNRSDFTVDRVYFTIETYDANGNPLVCNTDGMSNSFNGVYRLELGPDERSEHYKFDFGNYVQPTESIASVNIKVTSWRDTEGYTRNIPEDEWPSQSYRRFIPVTPTPAPAEEGAG